MDGLGATSSIISILKLIGAVVNYINSVCGASQQRKTLRLELRACKNILQALKDESDDTEEGKTWSDTIKALEAPGAPLGRLKVALDAIEAKLRPSKIGSLKWPFKEAEVRDILGAIEREKALLELSLQNNSRKLIQEIKRTADKHTRQLLELKGNFSTLGDDLANIQDSQTSLQRTIEVFYHHEDDRELEEKWRLFLKWLAPINYSDQQSEFVRYRHPHTCQWLLESPVFNSWIEEEDQILFCPGIPGAGKTIMASTIIDDLVERSKNDTNVGIAYIYCNYNRRHEQTLGDMLANLLRQLAANLRIRNLPKPLDSIYKRHCKTETHPSLNELSDALQSVASLFSRAYLVIDALDECGSENGCRCSFLRELFNLQSLPQTRILITSRDLPEISSRLRNSLRLPIRANESDVRTYVQDNLVHLPAFVQRKPDLQEEIKDRIVNTVNGMFLLAKLYIDDLVGKSSPKKMQLALRNLPTGSKALDGAYENAMMRIEGQIKDQADLAKRVLVWVSQAERQLTVSELQHALATEVGASKLDQDNISDVEDMVSACVGLIVVDESAIADALAPCEDLHADDTRIVRLVHYTAQEYFSKNWETLFPDAHETITQACLAYMSFDNYQHGPCTSEEEFRERSSPRYLFDYAANHWGSHAKEIKEAPFIAQFLMNQKTFDAWSQCYFVTSRDYGHSRFDTFPRSFTGLHLAAYYGIEYAVEAILKVGVKETVDSEDRTPLVWAAQRGHDAVVKMLLLHSLATNSTDIKHKQASLSLASSHGHERIVKLLLDYPDVYPDSANMFGWTPLSLAASNGHEAVVTLLLQQTGVDINSRDGFDWTPLHWAAENGREAICKILISHPGVDPASTTTYGWSPLQVAANKGFESILDLFVPRLRVDLGLRKINRPMLLLLATRNGHKAVVELLLQQPHKNPDLTNRTYRYGLFLWAAQKGYKDILEHFFIRNYLPPDARDRTGRTALSWAAEKGYDYAAKLLLEQPGVDADSKDDDYKETPLSWAAKENRLGIVKLLIEHPGVDLNSKSKVGKTPLSLASEHGHAAVVGLLLQQPGVNLDSIDDESEQTALLWAAQGGHSDVAMLLLAREDINPDLKNRNGRTALSLAVENGHEPVVQMLITQSGVDVNSRDDEYGHTPLSLAAQRGHCALVELLLQQPGVDPNSRDKYGWTPIAFAIRNNHETVSKLLLEHHQSNINTKTISGWTPLSIAVRNDNNVITTLLLSHRHIDVNIQTNCGWSPLLLSVKNDNEVIVDLLLSHPDVDPDMPDKNGWTPLLVATVNGNESIVRRLVLEPKVNPDSKTNDGLTPISIASANCNEHLVRLLLSQPGVDPDSKTSAGWTPLSLAAANNNPSVVKILLEQPGVNPNSKTTSGLTPLMVAARDGSWEIVRILLSEPGVNPNHKSDCGQTPLSLAADIGNQSTVRVLLDHPGVNPNITEPTEFAPLSLAAKRGHNAIVKMLLSKLDPSNDLKNSSHHAALALAARNDSYEIVKLLLNQIGIDPLVNNHNDWTQICLASSNGYRAAIRSILARPGAATLLNTSSGWKDLYSVARNDPDTVVDLLSTQLEVDSNSSEKNYGRILLLWAAQNGHSDVARLLIENSGIDPNSTNSSGLTPLALAAANGHEGLIKLLLARPDVDGNFETCSGDTLLSLAADNGHKSAIEILVALPDTEIEAKDLNGWTPLMRAAHNGHDAIVELLIQLKATIELKDISGRTPLLLAAMNGHVGVVQLLLTYPAVDPESMDTNGWTPLIWAAQNGHLDVLELLVKRSVSRKSSGGQGIRGICADSADLGYTKWTLRCLWALP